MRTIDGSRSGRGCCCGEGKGRICNEEIVVSLVSCSRQAAKDGAKRSGVIEVGGVVSGIEQGELAPLPVLAEGSV